MDQDKEKLRGPDGTMPKGSPDIMRVPNNTQPLPKPEDGKMISPRPSDSSTPSQKE